MGPEGTGEVGVGVKVGAGVRVVVVEGVGVGDTTAVPEYEDRA